MFCVIKKGLNWKLSASRMGDQSDKRIRRLERNVHKENERLLQEKLGCLDKMGGEGDKTGSSS